MQEINVLVDQKNGAIGFNFEEIKVVLKNGLEEYRHMEFTEESKKEAKATVASLRKLKKSVNEKRLEVKNSFMVPYNNFEAQVKELDLSVSVSPRKRLRSMKCMHQSQENIQRLPNCCHLVESMTVDGRMLQQRRKPSRMQLLNR